MKTRSLNLAWLVPAIILLAACRQPAFEIQAPYPDLDIPNLQLSLNADMDTTLVLANGSRIDYKAGTLVDKDGNPAQGQVNLLYREFHDGVDIFLSGIPMGVSTPKGERTLQTAGMFQLNARQGENELQIAEGKSIGITLASKYTDNNYGTYYLDETKGSWDLIGKPETASNTAKTVALEQVSSKKIEKMFGPEFMVLNTESLMDIYFDNDWDKINRQRHKAKIPEALTAYGFTSYGDIMLWTEVICGKGTYLAEEILWRDLDGTGFPKWMNGFQVEWKATPDGRYIPSNLFSVRNPDKTYTFTLLKNGKKLVKQMEPVIPLQILLRQPAEKLKEGYEAALREMEEEQKKIDLMADTYRTFNVRRLGIYNFDRLLEDEGWLTVQPNFRLQKEEKFQTIVMLLEDNSAIVKAAAGEPIKVNPAGIQKIFIPLENNEAEVFEPSTATAWPKAKPADGTVPSVEIRTKRVHFKDQQEFRAFLGF